MPPSTAPELADPLQLLAPQPKRLLVRAGAWFERQGRPRLLLSVVVLVLYGPTVLLPFFIDDYRNLRMMDDYHAGRRASLDLYRFFTSDADNAKMRMTGLVPWWLAERLRFGYLRPLAEYSLYGDYLLFGHSPAGYHATSVVLYGLAVLLVFELYRAMQPSEVRARWAALLFAVAASQVIPITFVAARCDLLALIGVAAAVLASIRFARGGGVGWAVLVAAATLGAAVSKESATLCWLGFLLMWVGARATVAPEARRAADRRALAATGLMLALVAAVLAYRKSQALAMDMMFVVTPLQHAREYFTELPIRSLQFLTAWLLPVNPALLLYHSSGRGPLRLLTVVGAVGLAAVGMFLWRKYRRDPSVRAAALWPLAFLPVISCVPPDARLLILPLIGLSYLSSIWLRTPIDLGSRSARWLGRYLPGLLFLVAPVPVVALTTFGLWGLESKAAADVRHIMGDVTEQKPKAPRIFFLNAVQPLHAIWSTDRIRYTCGPSVPPSAFLCDLPYVDAKVIDDRTLRLTPPNADEPFLSGLLGQFGLTHGTVFHGGERFEAPEFVVTVAAVHDGRPTALDLRFRKPLTDPDYFFFHLLNDANPRVWVPRPGESRHFAAFAGGDRPR